jgi:quinol---cytochrome-c reductase cytochrome c subunit
VTRRPPSDQRRSRRLQAALLLTVLLAAGAVTLALSRGTAGAQPENQLASYVTARPPDVNAGQRIFLRDCAYCHGDAGQGTSYGPRLTTAGTAYVDFMLSTGRMPIRGYKQPAPGPQSYPRVQVQHGPPAYSPAEIADIVAYTATFITSGPAVPVVAPGDLASGRDLFLVDCAPCHSSSGTGMILPAGAFAPELYPSTSREIAEAIRIGPGPMPGFTVEEMSASDADDVVTYVRDLGDNQDIGGHPLDFFGPIAEGIVAWLIPIPLLIIFIRLLGKKAPK